MSFYPAAKHSSNTWPDVHKSPSLLCDVLSTAAQDKCNHESLRTSQHRRQKPAVTYRYSKLVTLDQTGRLSPTVIGNCGLEGDRSVFQPSGLVTVYLELITKERRNLTAPWDWIQTLREGALRSGSVTTKLGQLRQVFDAADIYKFQMMMTELACWRLVDKEEREAFTGWSNPISLRRGCEWMDFFTWGKLLSLLCLH